jgi:energy-converting hydrogenase Eha subunit B
VAKYREMGGQFREMGGSVGSTHACYGSFLGSNTKKYTKNCRPPDISKLTIFYGSVIEIDSGRGLLGKLAILVCISLMLSIFYNML